METRQITLGSLFDGIGGWPFAALHAGVRPAWASEIEKFPQAVTGARFPNMLQLGDITKIDGAEIEPVDIVCMGSPCQDLSVAGRQAGLKGERSWLFHVAVELIRRMRMSTGGYPRYIVWENVPGAFSSNRGMDFRAVLESLTKTDIPIPRSGRWAAAGMVRSPECDVCWRVLDAQYWGVPQRRKRVFLVADFRTERRCADKILFERESVRGDTQEGRKEREAATARIGGGSYIPSKARCLTARMDGSPCADRGPEIIAVYENHGQDSRIKGPLETSPAINAQAGTGGNNLPLVAYGIGRDAFNQGKNAKFGITIKKEIMPTILARGPGAVFSLEGNGARPSHHGDGWSDNGKSYTLNTIEHHAVAAGKTVRRLTPLECERLMGLPDGYTLIDDKTCSDTARYKALGNGMAQPCADYVIRRIVEAVEDEAHARRA